MDKAETGLEEAHLHRDSVHVFGIKVLQLCVCVHVRARVRAYTGARTHFNRHRSLSGPDARRVTRCDPLQIRGHNLRMSGRAIKPHTPTQQTVDPTASPGNPLERREIGCVAKCRGQPRGPRWLVCVAVKPFEGAALPGLMDQLHQASLLCSLFSAASDKCL